MAAPIKTFAGIFLVILAFAVSGFAEENEQSQNQERTKDSETPAATPVEKKSAIFRSYPASNPFSEAIKLAPSRRMANPAPAPSVSTKRESELLDRRRNWIFITPDDEAKTESVEQIFGVENFLGQKKSQGVVSQFLKNDQDIDPEWLKENEANQFLAAPELEIAPRNQNPLTTQRNTLDPNWQRKISGFSPEQSRLAELWREHSMSSKAREDKVIRMKEFDDLFQPQNSLAASGNTLNALGQNILAAPSTAAARSLPDPFNPAVTSPTSLDRLGASVRTTPTPNVFERSDSNARVFGTPLATPLPVETSRPERPPAILSIPKRKL